MPAGRVAADVKTAVLPNARAVAVLLAGRGSSHRYTVSEVKQAFTRAGLHHPKVQTTAGNDFELRQAAAYRVRVDLFRRAAPGRLPQRLAGISRYADAEHHGLLLQGGVGDRKAGAELAQMSGPGG